MIAPLNDLARFYHEGEGNVGLMHFYQLLSCRSGVKLKPMQKSLKLIWINLWNSCCKGAGDYNVYKTI